MILKSQLKQTFITTLIFIKSGEDSEYHKILFTLATIRGVSPADHVYTEQLILRDNTLQPNIISSERITKFSEVFYR